ncbi:MAG: 2-C-methyl-D-erythritol 2,4-cyclodiphosphate synthase [Clostridia bacterium]|nr:2-C-methyl-D-erythritol 2,4-cyclodiphosphate synthase [Clostridia bacterium]
MSAAVIVAAGRGTRMHSEKNKIFLPLLGTPIIVRTVRTFKDSGCFEDGIIVVTGENDLEQMHEVLSRYGLDDVTIVLGGATRQESVSNGIGAVARTTDFVAIQDAARPLITLPILKAAMRMAREKGNATVAVESKDTIKRVDAENRVVETLNRSDLRVIQTPQIFRLSEILEAHRTFKNADGITDDAMLMEKAGKVVYLSEGSPENLKITTPEDMIVAEQILRKRGEAEKKMEMRIGHGYDVHKLVTERDLILCGVKIDYEKGLLGHSDADVAAHALMDAMLGAAAMGDIGYHFPDTDERYRGADSMMLLEEVTRLISEKGWTVSNADLTIICQRPKLRPYIEDMRRSLARHIGVDVERISVKATTTEHLGFEGEGLGISTHAVVMLERGASFA